MWMLVMSMGSIPFALVFPEFWVQAAVLVIAAAIISRRAPPAARRPRARELAALLIVPLAIVVWANTLRASLENAPGAWHWQTIGVIVLVAAQLPVAVWLLVRHRARLVTAAVAAVLATAWAHGAMFIAFMALHNDWI